VLVDPRRSATLTTSGVLVALTLSADAHVPLPSDPDDHEGRGFFAVGVRLGLLYGPALSDWALDGDIDVRNTPPGTLRGAYALLAIGFGGGTLHDPAP